ncbi:MAG: T9SS type A sorting domain-containing protein [Bacteroidia bacterium]|nr:T9SS type A sorting domain-containing protein [Bacteroidia bacterium]
MKKHLLYALLLLSSSLAIAQSWVEKMQNPNGNFYEAQADFENYWLTHDRTEKGKGYKAFKRWEYFVEHRVYPSGNLALLNLTAPNFESFLKDYQSKNSGPGKTIGGGNNLIASATWTPIGPMGAISGNAGGQLLKSGRLNFVTVNPVNPNDLWVGAPSGGLWHSANGGSTWSTNTDNLSVIGCSDLAIDPTNTLVMYLATGDGDSGDTRSIGVLKSTNGGATWSATGLSNVVTSYLLIRRLIINPNNTQIILAATTSGIYRSINGGTNWTLVSNVSTYDLEFKPSHPNVVYASGNTFRMSLNGGVTWTQISNGIPTTGVNRMAIAVTPADTNYVYVLASSSSNSGFQGFYRSTVGGTLFTQMTTTVNVLGWSALGNDTGGQGWYTLCVAASPLDKNEVVTGGVNVWRTTNGGTSWSIYGHWTGNVAPFTHADIHDVEYDAAGTLYNANDGTIYRRSGGTWLEISSGMNISQIYRIGMSSTTANKWITGHQDNGTSIWTGTTYSAALGGDGMDCFIDRTSDMNVFGEYQNGGLQRSLNGGASWSGVTTGLTGTSPWLTVWKQDPQSANIIYVGRQNLFKSTNLASSWGTLTPFTATNTIIEFAIAPSNNQIIYVLKSTGIFKTINAGVTWTNVTGSVPVGSATPKYICIDPTDPNNAWVVLSGYSSGNKVFVTTNGGVGWLNYTANLPNIPANCVVYQPGSNDRIYVGMDVGIYYRDNSLSNWVLYNTNLPNVPVSELEISPASPTLLHAATYGRGVWVASLYVPGAPPVSSFSVTSNLSCVGSVITFSDLSTSTPTAWLWSVNPSAGVAINSSTIQNPSITFPGAGNYTVSLQSNNSYGTGSTYTQVVTILGPPVISISASSQSVCPGSVVGYTASGAGSYTWSGGGGTNAISSFTPLSSTVYTVTGKTSGCTNTKTVSVTLYALPSVSVSGSQSTCAGNSNLLVASGANSYTWSNGQTFSFVNVSPSVTTVYTIAAVGNNTCLVFKTFTLTVIPLPQINISSADTIICLNEASVLNATGAVNYTWLPGNTNGSAASYTPVSTSNYTCIGVDADGCENSAAFTVIVERCEGIEQILQLGSFGFNVFPNPVKNKLTIRATKPLSENLILEITDVAGKLILKQSLRYSGSEQSADISLTGFAPGTYYLTLTKGSEKGKAIKIIKE